MDRRTIIMYFGLGCVVLANVFVGLSFFGSQDSGFQSKCSAIIGVSLVAALVSLVYANREIK